MCQLQADGQALLAFRCPAATGFARPTAFEILCAAPGDDIADANPVATIDSFPPDQEQFEIIVPAPALPAQYAVRPVAGERRGEPNSIITIPAGPQPVAPQILGGLS